MNHRERERNVSSVCALLNHVSSSANKRSPFFFASLILSHPLIRPLRLPLPLPLLSSLQGSEDDRRWVTLKSHDDDQSIAAKGFSTHTFPVGWQALYFRHFRLIQTGPTSDGGFTMAVGGFEVYGSLRDLRDRRGRAERRPRGTTRNVAHSFPMGK